MKMHGAPSYILSPFMSSFPHDFHLFVSLEVSDKNSPKDAPTHVPTWNPLISSKKNVVKKINVYTVTYSSVLFLIPCPFYFACTCYHSILLTISFHGILVHNSNIFQESTHGSLCDIVCAIFIEKLGICTKVILIRQITQSPEHVLVQSQVSASHLKLGCLYF